jgi:hypothetical protein
VRAHFTEPRKCATGLRGSRLIVDAGQKSARKEPRRHKIPHGKYRGGATLPVSLGQWRKRGVRDECPGPRLFRRSDEWHRRYRQQRRVPLANVNKAQWQNRFTGLHPRREREIKGADAAEGASGVLACAGSQGLPRPSPPVAPRVRRHRPPCQPHRPFRLLSSSSSSSLPIHPQALVVVSSVGPAAVFPSCLFSAWPLYFLEKSPTSWCIKKRRMNIWLRFCERQQSADCPMFGLAPISLKTKPTIQNDTVYATHTYLLIITCN